MSRHRISAYRGGVSLLAIAASLSFALPLAIAADKPVPPPKVFPQSPDILVLKKTVHRVVVDVVVRGSDRKPVHGLTGKDFSVAEDGQPQRVLSFDVHDFDTTSISIPPGAPHLPPNVFVNVSTTAERGPLYVILYDMVNMETEDQMGARQQVVNFVHGKPAGTRFAVFSHSDGLHLVQGFTDDKDLLYSAVDPKNPRAHLPMSFLMARNFGRGDPVAMISVLTHIAEFLDGIPGRKNLMWLSGSFPMEFYPRVNDPNDLKEDTRRLVNELTRAQVAVYPINIRGVVINPEGALTGGGTPHSGVGGASPGPSLSNTGASPTDIQQDVGMLQYTNGSGSLSNDYATQDDIAAATGGRAVYSDNDVKGMLDEAVEDGANYYSLSYSPTNPNYDGKLRRIQVNLAHRGYQLAYRRAYYADDPDVPTSRPKKNESEEEIEQRVALEENERPLFANLQHGAPQIHQLIFKARVHPIGEPAMATPEQMAKLAEQPAYTHGKSKASHKSPKPVRIQRYAIYYALVASQIKTTKDGALPLEFAAVAFDPDGWVANGIVEKAQGGDSSNPFAAVQPGPPESWEQSQQPVYRAMQELDVPLNATSLRVIVRDTLTDRVGAMEIPLPLVAEPQISAVTAAPVASATN